MRGIVLSLLGALMLVLCGPVSPAPAAVAFEGVTSTHAVGMPSANAPWRTLVQGGMETETAFNTWAASAQLAGPIPAGETIELTWVAGRRTPTSCEPITTFVERTSEASHDNTVSIMRMNFPTEEGETPGATPTCLEVSITSRGMLTDRLVGPVRADDAAAAVIGVEASATEHRLDHPKVTDPWRTLESASLRGDVVTGTVQLSATLGGPVPEGQWVSVTWALGRRHPHGCETLVAFSWPNLPQDSSHTMSVERDYDNDDIASEFTCIQASLYTLDTNTTGDIVDGPASPLMADVTVDAAPAAEEFVVAAGRSTPVIVTASSRVGARKGLTVAGRGKDVRAAKTSTGAVEARRERPVVVRVAAERPGRSQLRLTARDVRFDVARSTTRWPVKVRRVEAQRPRPGRYESADGTVGFKVTRDFVVRALRVADVRCEGAATLPTARLPRGVRLPSNGAAARVVRSGDPGLGRGFLGAQLLTTSPTRVVGTLTVATRNCTGSARFAAVRQG
ncbi:hypothetical protein ASG88_19470 [Nocardioides sp. Soil777]|nr:hypothetical protein ASG88_19470 [Nocardioides sp. Soil777]